MNENRETRRDSNYANQTSDPNRKQKLVYSSAVEIINNNPRTQARDRDLSNPSKKKTPNPLQKSVQLPQTNGDGNMQYGGSNDPKQTRASNLMLENNNFIKKFTDFGANNAEQ